MESAESVEVQQYLDLEELEDDDAYVIVVGDEEGTTGEQALPKECAPQVPGKIWRTSKSPCLVCGKLVLVRNMKLHMDTHEDPKYKCSLCPAKFRTERTLVAHVNIHLGDRPYVCDVCGYSYTTKEALNVHTKTHGEKLFQCRFCKKKFARKDCLDMHLRTHTKEKPFQCSECSKNFTKKAASELHIRKKHLGQPPIHSCTECNKKFYTTSQLRRHLELYHKMILLTRKMLFKNIS